MSLIVRKFPDMADTAAIEQQEQEMSEAMDRRASITMEAYNHPLTHAVVHALMENLLPVCGGDIHLLCVNIFINALLVGCEMERQEL